MIPNPENKINRIYRTRVAQPNLWRDTLCRVFKRCAIPEIWKWVSNHAGIQRYFQEVRGDGSTLDSELRNFVLARNQATHGDVEEILSFQELHKIASFLKLLCSAIAEAVHRELIIRKMELGQAQKIGEVIKEFGDNVVAVRMFPCQMTVGDSLVMLSDRACYTVSVDGIQINNDPFETIEIDAEEHVGLKLSSTAKKGAEVTRLV